MDDLLQRVEALETYLDIEGRRSRLADLEQLRLDPSYWNDTDAAQETEKEVSVQKTWVEAFESLLRRRDDILTLRELQAEEDDADLVGEIDKETRLLEREVDAIELRGMLSGEDAHRDAIVNINPGAGGTEAQDWAFPFLKLW